MGNNSLIRDVYKGRWAVEIKDYITYPIHRARLFVIYESEQMEWWYESTVSVEIAMSRYEDQEYSRKEVHSETEFSSREELINRLIAYIPNRNGAKTHEAAIYGFDRNTQTEQQLRKGLDSFFRKETSGSTAEVRLRKAPAGPETASDAEPG